MAILLAFPILGGLLMLQSAVISRLPLLNGTADLILLSLAAWALNEKVKVSWQWAILGGVMVGAISAEPLYVPIIGYLAVVLVARLLQHRIWQSPIIALFITIFIGTLVTNMISLVVLQFDDVPLPLFDSLNLVILPSALLNLILSLPVYVLMKDIAQWLYPIEVE